MSIGDKVKAINEIEKIIKENGLKLTPQRIAVLDFLYKSREHPTAEEIFSNVKDALPSISLGTVYKTLDKFIETGLVNQIDAGGDKTRYDAFVDSHFHLISEDRSKVVDFFDNELHSILESYFHNIEFQDFSLQNYNLQLIGIFKNTKE